MKLKIVLIAVLLAVFAVSPALAASKVLYADPMILKDSSGVQIELNRIDVTNEPAGSYFWTYPPDQYDYYQLHYTLYNPTDHEIRYEFNITFVDSNGNVYTTEDNPLAYGIGPGRRVSDYMKEFPIPRNATGLYMRWSYINTYLNEREWTNIALQAEPVPTPTVAPTATPTPSATPVPTATAKPTPVNGLLPLFALGIVVCGLCAVKMYSEHTARRK